MPLLVLVVGFAQTGTWEQLGSSFVAEGSGDYLGHSVAISSDGNRVVLGGQYNDGAGHNAGHVRVFQYGGTNWSQLGEDLDGEATEDQFGYAVDLSSTWGLDTGLAAGVVLIGCRGRVGSVGRLDPSRRHFCRRSMDGYPAVSSIETVLIYRFDELWRNDMAA